MIFNGVKPMDDEGRLDNVGKLVMDENLSILNGDTIGRYPLVNVYITMENHRAMGKLTISMAIFNSKLLVTRGYY